MGTQHEASAGRCSRVHLTAVDLDPFTDASQAPAQPVTLGGTGAVVSYLDLHSVSPISNRYDGLLGVGVLEGVGQALLNDPIRRKIDRTGQREGLALDV